MRRFFFPAGLVVLVAALTAAVLFGRHGEYSAPYTVAAGPTAGSRDGVHVTVDGGVIRNHGDRDRPLEVWATRPESSLLVEGATERRPVLIRNALPLSAYGPIAPGVQAVEGTLLVLTAPGAYFFRPRHQERYQFLVLGDSPRPPGSPGGRSLRCPRRPARPMPRRPGVPGGPSAVRPGGGLRRSQSHSGLLHRRQPRPGKGWQAPLPPVVRGGNLLVPVRRGPVCRPGHGRR